MPMLDSTWIPRLALLVYLSHIVYWNVRRGILPDRFTLPGMAAGVVANALYPFVTLRESALGLAAGFLGLWAIEIGSERLQGQPALGGGVKKLMGVVGAHLGAERLLVTLMLATLTGSLYGLSRLVRGRGGTVELGFFVAPAALMAMLFPFHEWYRSLLDN